MMMLLQFTVGNFRTFKDPATLSLVASNYDKDTREAENIFDSQQNRLRLLKSAVIYGANASGKSKLLEAMAFMRHFAINSSKDTQIGDSIPVRPFLLSSETTHAPSEFEIVFLFEGALFRYGFEATAEKIVSEWLYHKPKTKEIELFYRENGQFEVNARKFPKGMSLVRENLVRENALLLSVAAQFNDLTAKAVIEAFKRLKFLSGTDEMGYQGFTMGKTDVPSYKTRILELLKAADLSIQDIRLQKMNLDDLPKGMPKEMREEIMRKIKEEQAAFVDDVLTIHKKYDENKQAVGHVELSLDDDESSGTRKFFALTGPILDVLEHGHVLVVDELDAKIHPNLVCKLVSMFNSTEYNPNNAQLIFNTHDTNLLRSGLFRRDQIWFTDKDRYGEAKLYSLANFKSEEVKKHENFEENYLRGKYGAIPYLALFDMLNFTSRDYQYEEKAG